MITKVTQENAGLYKALFERVNEALGYEEGTDEYITSLDKYFSNIKAIASEDGVYTILPLDEPTFDIDADSRVITVPEVFRKNGISVQGDQIAEIIYFTVDRYVDTVDLYRDDINIVIQWETAPDTSSKGNTTEKGISMSYLRDATLFQSQGKILFGWALNDAITQYAGTLKFSVRFYRANEDGLDFSLSTLIAQATINPGMNYAWQGDNTFAEKLYDTDKNIIESRLKNSVYIGEAGEIDAPVILKGLAGDYELDGYKAADIKSTKVEGIQVFQRDFIVQGTGVGYISYAWTRSQDGGLATNLTSDEVIYSKINDTTWDTSKNYYYKTKVNNIETFKIYSLANGTQTGDKIPFNEDGTIMNLDEASIDGLLYEKVDKLTISEHGLYTVEIINKKGTASNHVIDTIYIPGPDSNFTLEPENPADAPQAVLLDENGEATLSVLGKTDRVTSGNMPGDDIVYTWGDSKPVTVQNTTGATPQEYKITVAEADKAKYDNTLTVSVYATRNKANTEIKTNTYRITDKAHAPEVEMILRDVNNTKDIENNMISFNYNVSNDIACRLTAKVTNLAEILSDDLTFEWHKYAADEEDNVLTNDPVLVCKEDDDCITVDKEAGTCEFLFRPKHLVEKGVLGLDELSGAYYCIVKNTVNGSEADNSAAIEQLDLVDITETSIIRLIVES